MSITDSNFPFFVATPVRHLTDLERATVLKLLDGAEPKYREQAERLQVVGRCGCGQCPTVFFEHHTPGVHEQDLVEYAGTDEEGGTVAVVLLQKQGRLSQLEYYSLDGHFPWRAPMAQDLGPMR